MNDVDTKSSDQALDQLIQRYESLSQSGWSDPAELRLSFEAALDELDAQLTHEEIKGIWSGIMKPRDVPELLAIQQVYRPSGSGQVSLFQGDVFQLPADQWICSAYQSVVSPSGGAWEGFWRAAGRAGQPWPENDQPPLEMVNSDKQIGILEVNPKEIGGLPTIVLFGLESRRFDRAHEAGDPHRWVEEVYFEALCLCRRYARQNRLGERVASPVMFSMLHGVPFDEAIRLQRSFALDLLHQEPTVKEVMISVYQPEQASELLSAWHVASGDKHRTLKSEIPEWVQRALPVLSHELREQCLRSADLSPDTIDNIRSFLHRFDQESLFLNDLAVMARNIVEKWAQQCCERAELKESVNLAMMVSQLRGRSGSPNRSIQYLDALRELGNVGAHFNRAPHPLEPSDLITMLTGLNAMIKLDGELARP